MNLFELFVKIGVDDSKVEPGIEKIKKSMASASTLISAKAVAIGNAIYDMGKQGVKALTNLAKIGLDYNSQMEQYTTNFTTMLGSQESAVQKVEELKKFAASTPLSMDDLAKGTQTLLAFGVESENSTKILRQLGDIALGDADKMQRLSTAFGKATAAGKVTGDTVQQMIDAGWNPLIQISKAAGETMEETQKRMSAGTVSVEELQAAMEAVTSGTGQFAGGMEAASHTTQGLISTLQDNVKSKIGEAFQSVSDILQSEVLPRAIEFVNSINVDSIIENVNGLVSTFIKLSPVIASATAATLAYKSAVSISKVIDVVRKATEGQTIAQAALNAVMNANPFVLVTTLIVGLVAAIITLWNTNEGFRNALISAWEAIGSAANKIFTSVANFFKETIPNAFNSVIDWFKNVGKTFEDIGKNIVTAIGNGIKSLASDAVQWGKDLIQNFINGLLAKWNALKQTVSNVAQTVKDFLGFSEPKKGPLSNFHTYAPDMMNLFIQGIRDNEKKLTDQIEKTFDFGERTITAGISYGSYGDGGFSIGNGYSADQVSVVQNSVRAAIHDEISKIGIYLDGNTLVGGISDRMNQGLGSIYAGNERRAMA